MAHWKAKFDGHLMSSSRPIISGCGNRLEASLADGRQGLRNHILRCVNCQCARTQLKAQSHDAGYLIQQLADLALLDRAVHGGNAEQWNVV